MKILNINVDIEKLSDSQKIIADFVMRNEKELPYLSIDEIAKELGISIATVSRFWKDIGFKNFKEVKEHLKEELKITPASKMKTMLNKVTESDLAGEIISQQIMHLQDTMENLSRENLHKAVQAIMQARNIYVFGPGPSECLSDILQFRLNRFGLHVIQLPKSGREIYEYLVHAQNNDVVILTGFLRPLPETKVILEHAKVVGYTTILLTDLMVSEMIDTADITLYACRGEKKDYHSMVVPMAVIDCLVIEVALSNEKRNLEKLHDLYELRKKFLHYIPR